MLPRCNVWYWFYGVQSLQRWSILFQALTPFSCIYQRCAVAGDCFYERINMNSHATPIPIFFITFNAKHAAESELIYTVFHFDVCRWRRKNSKIIAFVVQSILWSIPSFPAVTRAKPMIEVGMKNDLLILAIQCIEFEFSKYWFWLRCRRTST